MAVASPRIQDKVNKGWRKEASKLGQRYDVLRQEELIATDVPFIMTRWVKVRDLEMAPVSDVYRARGDRTKLKLGDYLVGKEVESKRQQSTLTERFTVVQMRILRDTMVIRTDRPCKIFRPESSIEAGDVSPQYSFQSIRNALELSYDTGSKQWSFAAQPAVKPRIWCNIVYGRGTDYRIPQELPTTTEPTGWIIGLKLLPGIVLQEGDIVLDETDNGCYRITRPYFQDSTANLYQMQATKLRA